MKNGVIIVFKEKGMTSFGVVARLRRIFNQKKIGHTGTLDPDAEGVLPVCLGRATRLVEDLSHGTKTYRAVLLLGRETDTQDVSGKTLREYPVDMSPEEVKEAILSFSGKVQQLPPMYSALKVNGKKLVDLARKGIEVERKSREVEFSRFVISDISLPRVTFEVTCSHGAYIRTLCHDIGAKLGCGGCMESLLRTEVEGFCLSDALTLSQIEERVLKGDTDFVMAPDRFYRDLPAATVKESWLRPTLNGRAVPLRKLSEADLPGERIRLYAPDGSFIGIYRKEGTDFQLLKYYYEGEDV